MGRKHRTSRMEMDDASSEAEHESWLEYVKGFFKFAIDPRHFPADILPDLQSRETQFLLNGIPEHEATVVQDGGVSVSGAHRGLYRTKDHKGGDVLRALPGTPEAVMSMLTRYYFLREKLPRDEIYKNIYYSTLGLLTKKLGPNASFADLKDFVQGMLQKHLGAIFGFGGGGAANEIRDVTAVPRLQTKDISYFNRDVMY